MDSTSKIMDYLENHGKILFVLHLCLGALNAGFIVLSFFDKGEKYNIELTVFILVGILIEAFFSFFLRSTIKTSNAPSGYDYTVAMLQKISNVRRMEKVANAGAFFVYLVILFILISFGINNIQDIVLLVELLTLQLANISNIFITPKLFTGDLRIVHIDIPELNA